MSDTCKSRPMGFSDIDALVSLELASFSVPWSRQMLEEELYNPQACYRVLECQGRIAGYAGMWKILDEGHITNIAVHPDFRRNGYGRRLICELLDIARREGIIAVTLEVRVSNLPAISLYESLGFKQEGRRKRYYSDNNEDALIMWLRIDEKDS